MKTVGVRTLRDGLSEYLRMVQDGERLAVTNRGVVVARLVPPDAPAETAEEALQRLARAGEIRLGKPNRPDLYPPSPGLLSDEQVAAFRVRRGFFFRPDSDRRRSRASSRCRDRPDFP